MNNLHFNINKTSKFKTVRMQLAFLSEPSKKEMSARAVLINMMKQQTQDYPTKAALFNHLHERYNMRLSALPSKIGRVQMLTFTIDFIHSDYTLEENDLIVDALDLLESIIKRPMFTQKIFLQEKRILQEYFDSIYADKAHYAMQSMLKHMYKEPVLYIDGLGDKEDLKDLSLADVKAAYKKLFDGRIICTILGNVDEKRVENLLKERFDWPSKQASYDFTIKHKDYPIEEVFIEKQTIKQTNVVLGLDCPVYFDQDDYLSMRFLNVILGGHSESMLFKEIREKQNMAYYISSSYNPYQGLLMIQTGIDQKNKDTVLQAIKGILKRMTEGDITDAVFMQSKKQLRNALIQSQDSQARLTSQASLQSIFGLDFSVEERLNTLENITKEDIARLAKKLTLSTIFILTGDAHA